MSDLNPYAPPQAELDEKRSFPVGKLVLADRGTRLGASMLDGLILLVPIGLILFLCYRLFGLNVFEERPTLDTFLIGLATSGFSSVLYFAINARWLASHGQSIGKRLCNIRIAKPDGSIPTLWDSFFKRYVMFLFVQDMPVVGRIIPLIDAVMIFRDNRKCLHDEWAGTIVVNVPPGQR